MVSAKRWRRRFILTCVGTTAHQRPGYSSCPVHPHMRGDHSTWPIWLTRSVGSSSHAWGPHLPASCGALLSRFILTCVGTTCWRRQRPIHQAVHPHMRGDHCIADNVPLHAVGSSSHAWGPLFVRAGQPIIWRFILTCVGTTAVPVRASRKLTVHPHMRGDHAALADGFGKCAGSSSHAWGPQRFCRPNVRMWRFILTCVGTTPSLPVAAPDHPVHPHMRGDHARVR